MFSARTISRASSALLVALLPIVVAHGGGHESMDMGHGGNATDSPKEDYPDTYFAHTEHTGVIYTHIALMVLAWVFVLPVGESPEQAQAQVNCFARDH